MNVTPSRPPLTHCNFPAIENWDGVPTDYVGAGLPNPRKRKRPVARRKRAYPGFRVRMMDFYCDEIRAVCECVGVNVRELIYETLLNAREAFAREIGMHPRDIAKLDRRQRAAIRRRYCLTVDAIQGKQSAGN